MRGHTAKLGLGALVFTAVLSIAYDDPGERKGNYFRKSDLDTVYNASFKVETTVKLDKKVDGEIEKSWFGSGTLLVDSQTGDNYLFTAEHITSDPILTSNKTGQTAKVLEERILVDIYEATIFKENEKYDLALLRLNGSPGKPFTGKIARYLDPGDYVLGTGFPNDEKLILSASVQELGKFLTPLNATIRFGNSGGGVFLVINDNLELCGIVTKVNGIAPLYAIQEFLKGTPLEDDYLK